MTVGTVQICPNDKELG